MSQVGIRELKDRLSGYLKRVQGGEEIVVTERGRSVARIVQSQSPSIKNFDKFFIIRYYRHVSLAS